MRQLVISVLAAALSGLLAHAQELRVLKDVTYGTASGRELKLDAYLSEGASLSPAVIFIHGGGWRRGDKAQVPEFLKQPMQDAGISIISVGYRLSDVAPYPAQVQDVTRAVQFVRYKSREWHLNPDRMAVMGPSAGGHLALWIGLQDDLAKAQASDPVERQSTRVSAIVNYFGPVDFYLLRKMEHKHPAYRTLFGYQETDPVSVVTEEQMRSVSPITYVSQGDPPVFTAHGAADVTVPVEHARRLIAKLKEAGVPNENYLLEGGNHGLSNPAPGWPDFRKATVEFLRKHLRGR